MGHNTIDAQLFPEYIQDQIIYLDCLYRQTSLVDQMMHMMEKYADHLEDLVNERTGQLAIEQKKTEELLSRMLPR